MPTPAALPLATLENPSEFIDVVIHQVFGGMGFAMVDAASRMGQLLAVRMTWSPWRLAPVPRLRQARGRRVGDLGATVSRPSPPSGAR